MFNITQKTLYHWRDLFFIFSLNKAHPYLLGLNFPLTDYFSQVENIAKIFVIKINKLENEGIFCSTGHIPKEVVTLVRRTDKNLRASLGDENTTLLIEWGNRLNFSPKVRASVWLYRHLLFPLDTDSVTPVMELPLLSGEKLKWLRSRISEYREKLRELSDELTELEMHPASTWEQEVLKMYSVDKNNGVEASPYTSLMLLIWNSHILSLLKLIQISFKDNEILALSNWMKKHPYWEKYRSRPEPYYPQPYDFPEVFEYINL